MLNLATTSSVIQLVTDEAVTSITVQASWSDLFPNTAGPGQTAVAGDKNTVITSTSTTTIVPSPAANTDRNVKSLIITNTSNSQCSIIIQHFDGTTTVPIWVPGSGGTGFVLLPQWVLAYSTDGGPSWTVYDETGTIQAGIALIAISAGTQSATSGTFIFSNANNVSFGMEGSSVITASFMPSLGSFNISAGTTSANVTAVTFANSNNVVFGFDGSNVTASAADLGAIAAGTQTATGGTVLFSNANGVIFGMSNQSVVTASVAINISAGTTSNNLSAITFVNSNGVSFGLNGSTMTASVVGTVGTVSCFSQDADFVTNFVAGQAILSFQKLSLPMNLLATQLVMLADFVGTVVSSDAVTVSHGVYTLSAGTASLVSSGSRVVSWPGVGYSSVSGTMYRTMSVSYAMTPGDYLFGWVISTANGAIIRPFGRAGLNIVGVFDGVETSAFLNGVSLSSVNILPASVAATNTAYARTGFSAMLQPGAILFGSRL